MKKRRLAMFVTVLTVSVCFTTTTHATNIEQSDDSLPIDEFYFDITSLGGITTSETNQIYVVTDTSAVKEPDSKVETSLDIDKEQDYIEDFYSLDEAAVKEVKSEDDKALQMAIRQEKVEQASWLSDYGLDANNYSNTRLDILQEGHKWLGSWYVWGGYTPPRGSDWTNGNGGGGFDCSGYTRYVLKTVLGIDISRTTYSQIGSPYLKRIPISEAQPGDIIFGNGIGHTGFFIKDLGGRVLIMHAPQSGKRLKISEYSKPSYAYKYIE